MQSSSQRRLLVSHARWVIRLRWIAGAVVLLGGVANWLWLQWFTAPAIELTILGGVILAMNAAFHRINRRRTVLLKSSRLLLISLAAQVVFDLSCIALLTLWTGSLRSPMISFFVLHMIFSSLLLSWRMAYGAAGFASIMVGIALVDTATGPTDREAILVALGWIITLFFSVYLANHITARLHRNELRLADQCSRILAMSQRLRDQQEAMIQHEKMVALGHMAAGVAHEITNPLASMDSVLQLMERRPDQPRTEAARTLREQIARIHQIMRQMTSFARPNDAGGSNVPALQIVESALQMVLLDKRGRDVSVERDFDKELARRWLLPGSMEQVIVNLCLNALDALRLVEDPQLIVRIADDGAERRIVVEDNGAGIPDENLSRIFEPFFTTKPVGKGTGLGLAISYRLVEMSGGVLEVRSRLGEGAAFTLRFPVSRSEGREDCEQPIPVLGKTGE